jgi:hypothetical protein
LRSFIEAEDQSQERQSDDLKRNKVNFSFFLFSFLSFCFSILTRALLLQSALVGEDQECEDEEAREKSKSSWLERDDEALDYLPGMIQVYEKSVLRLTLSPNKAVRLNAVAFVAAYLKQVHHRHFLHR